MKTRKNPLVGIAICIFALGVLSFAFIQAITEPRRKYSPEALEGYIAAHDVSPLPIFPLGYYLPIIVIVFYLPLAGVLVSSIREYRRQRRLRG